VINSNLGRISHRFRHMASFPLKNAHFSTPSIQPQIGKGFPCAPSSKFCTQRGSTQIYPFV